MKASHGEGGEEETSTRRTMRKWPYGMLRKIFANGIMTFWTSSQFCALMEKELHFISNEVTAVVAHSFCICIWLKENSNELPGKFTKVFHFLIYIFFMLSLIWNFSLHRFSHCVRIFPQKAFHLSWDSRTFSLDFKGESFPCFLPRRRKLKKDLNSHIAWQMRIDVGGWLT